MAEPGRVRASYRQPIVRGYYRFILPEQAKKEQVERFVGAFRKIYSRLSAPSAPAKGEVLER
jgi:hypothetical protein